MGMVAKQIAQLGQADAGFLRQRRHRQNLPARLRRAPPGLEQGDILVFALVIESGRQRLQARRPAALASASVVNSRTFCGLGGRAAQDGRQ